MPILSDHVVRWVRRIASPVLGPSPHPESAEILVDADTNTLKYGGSNGTHELLSLALTQTVTGTKTFSGTTAFTGATTGVRGAATVATTAAVTLTAAESGLMFVATATTGTQVFTLPLAATPGLTYTFVCGHADGEIHVGVGTGDRIVGKVSADTNAVGFITTTTTGLLKNTAASNVVGDAITLKADGLVTYYVVAQTGVYSAT